MQLDAKCRQIIKKVQLEKPELLSNEKISDYISILRKWIIKTHPDKGGNAELFKYAFECVNQLLTILRERKASGNYRDVFVGATDDISQKQREAKMRKQEEIRRKREEQMRRKQEAARKKKETADKRLTRETFLRLKKLAQCMKKVGFVLSDSEIKELYEKHANKFLKMTDYEIVTFINYANDKTILQSCDSFKNVNKLCRRDPEIRKILVDRMNMKYSLKPGEIKKLDVYEEFKRYMDVKDILTEIQKTGKFYVDEFYNLFNDYGVDVIFNQDEKELTDSDKQLLLKLLQTTKPPQKIRVIFKRYVPSFFEKYGFTNVSYR